MRDEFAARQRAIKLRLGGRPVQSICQALGRSEFWFHSGGAVTSVGARACTT